MGASHSRSGVAATPGQTTYTLEGLVALALGLEDAVAVGFLVLVVVGVVLGLGHCDSCGGWFSRVDRRGVESGRRKQAPRNPTRQRPTTDLMCVPANRGFTLGSSNRATERRKATEQRSRGGRGRPQKRTGLASSLPLKTICQANQTKSTDLPSATGNRP